jgi:hypothetical protein
MCGFWAEDFWNFSQWEGNQVTLLQTLRLNHEKLKMDADKVVTIPCM